MRDSGFLMPAVVGGRHPIPLKFALKVTTRFLTSHRWTVHFTPKSPKGATKRDFAVFASKIQLLSKERLGIRHIRHLLSAELTPTLTCSLILSRLDYCNAVLYNMVLQSAVFSNCSVSRTLRRGTSNSRQEQHMLYHCWNSYTGFLFVNGSSTNWPYWHSRSVVINLSVPRPSHQIASNFTSSSFFRHAFTAQNYYYQKHTLYCFYSLEFA